MKVKSFFVALSLVIGGMSVLNAAQPAAAPAATASSSANADSKHQYNGFPCNDWCTAATCKGRANVIKLCTAKHTKCTSAPAECQKHNKADKSAPNTFDCKKLCTEAVCGHHPTAVLACKRNCRKEKKDLPAVCMAGKMAHMKEKMHNMKEKMHHMKENHKGN